MSNKINLTPIALIVGIAIIMQLVLIGAESVETPTKVAKKFTEAYFYLDSDMQNYLCAELAKDGEAVDNYLYQKEMEAAQRGVSTNYLRHQFMNLHISIDEVKDDKMTFHVTGKTRVCINRPFMLIGNLFKIGDNYPVDAKLEIIKEDGQWRICGKPFDLMPQV